MVSIIKNQLLKHLSRFTKNLSADKINLSTFKGEGELTNLELNEIVLTDLLELPSWLRLTSAWCNKVSFRIQWTKLKNVPIVFSLDEVNITVETCEDLRPMSNQAGLSSYTAVPGKYSFIHKVIDGITVTVGTVNVTFNSPAFVANVQISRILVESKSPTWVRADLRMTRLKDMEKGQLLIFKELEWQTLRIEAKSTKDKNLTPLRLLTNQAKCRITIKKRLSDSFIMGSRLVVILDDLLWVLTDSQLKAALHFLDSLTGLIQKATQVTRKVKAARKLEELPEYRAQVAQQARAKDGDIAMLKIFTRFDVVETSYHFISHQIILHLCDDPGVGRSCHPNLKEGGALQICLQTFHVDYYPYHLARANRNHWPSYRESNIPHIQWQEQSFSSFKTRFFDLLDKNKTQHTPLTRANKGNVHQDGSSHLSHEQQHKKPQHSGQNHVKNFVLGQFAKIMTTCVIIRIEDFKVSKVTTNGKKTVKDFISGDRDHMGLPEDSKIVHAEFIYYYYPDDTPFPLPPPKFYVHLNPIQIVFDVDSCLWFNSFALNLYQSLLSSKQDISGSGVTYIDVKIEAILPRIMFESTHEYHTQKDRPKSLTFQATRATITNVRSLEQSSRADLAKCVDSFHMGSLFFGSEFPSNSGDFYIVTQKFLDHISATDNIRILPQQLDTSSVDSLIEQLSKEFLWIEAKDVWCVNLDPVWGDFMGARAVGSDKPVPFFDAMPITVWAHANMDPNSTVKTKESGPKNADVHALAHISNLVSIQLNHYQYLFLLRLAEEAAELTTYLAFDSDRILKVQNSGSLAIGALIPQLEITFVMPSQCPGKESSGGDVESFIPESSSIADDVLMGGSAATIWQNSSLSITQIDKKVIVNGSNMVVKPDGVVDYEQDFLGTKTPMKSTAPTLSNIVPNNLNAGISSMKEKFSSLMTSLDSALKNSPDDMSDTVSIRSDASSDSEKFVVLNLATDSQDRNNVPTLDSVFKVPEFQHEGHAMVEIASEVIEEENTITTTSDHSLMSSCRRKDLVSVSTFKLTKVEFLQQSAGYSSSIKVQVGNISSEDCCSIPWDEFQSKFSSRSRAWTDSPANSSTTTRVKLRMDHDIVLPPSKSISLMDFRDEIMNGMCRDFVDVHVNDLNLDLTMSTVTGLADLIEDEIIPIPIPLQISVNNVQLHLNEDRPPVNITSPGTVPVDLSIAHIFIERGKDGVFNIMQSKAASLSKSASYVSANEHESELQMQNRQLKADNEELRRRLVAFERVSEENRALRRSTEECEILRSCLTSAQGEVTKLLDEKQKLLDEVKRLHAQLVDRRQQWNSKR